MTYLALADAGADHETRKIIEEVERLTRAQDKGRRRLTVDVPTPPRLTIPLYDHLTDRERRDRNCWRRRGALA